MEKANGASIGKKGGRQARSFYLLNLNIKDRFFARETSMGPISFQVESVKQIQTTLADACGYLHIGSSLSSL